MAFYTMSTLSTILVFLCSLSPLLAAESQYELLGKPAIESQQAPEWNLTISPDGDGLPNGGGNARQGAELFAVKCAGCHGPGGIGGSALALVGEVGSLSSTYPEKTVNSYWPYATTLFDYIRRAMPPSEPYSLTADEVYALSAYILAADDVIPEEHIITHKTLPRVVMPNRYGLISLYPSSLN
jgi:S-disulfanyl-L-cysteine oxidoreductase SoxD